METPRVICKLELDFSSHEEAENVNRSVLLDNEGYLVTSVRGSSLLAEVKADSLKSLLHTLDDFLACTSVAERIVTRKVSPRSPSP